MIPYVNLIWESTIYQSVTNSSTIITSAGTLLYSPQKCCDIVIAVIVLHNMCVTNGIPLPPGNENPRDHEHIDRQQYFGNVNDGAAVGNRLINGRFSN
jgi:hypothetical protein